MERLGLGFRDSSSSLPPSYCAGSARSVGSLSSWSKLRSKPNHTVEVGF